MTRFDAPLSAPSASGSALKAAGALFAARFGLCLAALVPTVLALILATLLLMAGVVVPAALRQAFVASPVLVFATPNASRSDVDAIGRRLTALPDVATATLRSKEEALAALVAGGLPAPTDGRNPLPDVWTVALRGDGPSFMTEIVAARDAISAIPAVDRVRFDEVWAGSLDRAVAIWARVGVRSLAAALAGIALALFGVHVLFGRGLGLSDPNRRASVLPAIVLVGVGVLILSAAIGYGVCLVMADGLTDTAMPAMQPIAVVVGQSLGRAFSAVAGFGLFLALMGLGTGSPSHSFSPSK